MPAKKAKTSKVHTDADTIFHERSKGMLLKNKKRFKLIDAFSGAGGMSLGFSAKFKHPFTPVWANDFNDFCAQTYNANFPPHCVCGDIVDILNNPKTKIPKADVVMGGVPCQGHSLLNKNRKGDPRNQLWIPFMDLVRQSGASVFIIENVPQIIGSFEHGEIIGAAKELGFQVTHDILCAADYGVPQTRRRAFIIGWKHGNPADFFPPKRTYQCTNTSGRNSSKAGGVYVEKPLPWQTVRDAIADLQPPQGTEIRDLPSPLNLQFGRSPTPISLKRYQAIPKEGMNRFDLQKAVPELTPDCWIRKTSGGTDLFGRLWWDKPAVTIRTEFYKPEKGRYLHPKQHRPITHREAARFQSFPDDFVFKGSKIEIAKQIGNAVPPLLASRVADCVVAMLMSRS
jgi:DNA (cytosine-5)-methyltransferase 1